MDEVRILGDVIRGSGRAVFFGGAGVSTESGIPDFRGAEGLFMEKRRIPAEEVVSIDFFEAYPQDFYDFYRQKLVHAKARPNKAHFKLAEFERAGLLAAVITQNIDGLHQEAGSVNVIEMHGSMRKNYCIVCGGDFDMGVVVEGTGLPMCPCGGLIRPSVTLYGEQLDHDAIMSAVSYISKADTLIVAGTSLSVFPVAGLIGYFRGQHLVVINKTATPLDDDASLIIRAPVGETLDKIKV